MDSDDHRDLIVPYQRHDQASDCKPNRSFLLVSLRCSGGCTFHYLSQYCNRMHTILQNMETAEV